MLPLPRKFSSRVLGCTSTFLLDEHQLNSLVHANNWQLALFQPRRGYSHHVRAGQSNNNKRGPDMRNCRNIAELCQMAHDSLNAMSARDVSAFWTLAAKLIKQRDHCGQTNWQDAIPQVQELLLHTLERIGSFGYRDLAQTTLGLAKIVDWMSKNTRKGASMQHLHNLFIGDNSENKLFIFNQLAVAAIPMLHEFDSRSISNLIYAFGLAECVLEFEDGSSIFDAFANAAIPNLKNFNGQDMANMLWGYANVNMPNPALFEAAGDDIVTRCDLNTFKPQEVSNIVWSYATLGESHPELLSESWRSYC